MSTELVKVGTNLEAGGIGIDFSDPLFRLKPTTLTINQGQTQAEDAIPGKLRIVETNDQYTELDVVLLMKPQLQRSWYIGGGVKGSLNKTPENLMCFSRDMVSPDERSKQLQAPLCSACQHSQWLEDEDGKHPPQCDQFYYVTMLDTKTQLPMKMYIRGTSLKPFKAAMLTLARKIRLLQVSGHNVNLFDIAFKISTEKYVNKAKQTNYILKIDGGSFHMVTPEEREAFGGIYLDFISRQISAETEPVESEVVATNTTINSQLEEVSGEITV